MPKFSIPGPAEAALSTLVEALDLMDVGILLLDRGMAVRLINCRLSGILALPAALVASNPSFRDLLDYMAVHPGFAVPAHELPGYLDRREAAVCAGATLPAQIGLSDGRQLLVGCSACPDGGRILTCTDITLELRREAHAAMARVNADLRFSNETLEEQAAHLASLAESAGESTRRAEASRLELEHEIAARCQLEAELRRLATTDGLTGTLNRAEFLAAGQREMEQARQLDQALAVLMLDADHFKAINDRYGHAGGDLALQHMVAMLRAETRQMDLLGRLGGEEFAVVLPATTPGLAQCVAERLRRRIAEVPPAYGERSIEMTVSIGLSMRQHADQTIDQVIARADAALYRAKRSGRNRVVDDGHEIAAA